jgi:hypothetical protein
MMFSSGKTMPCQAGYNLTYIPYLAEGSHPQHTSYTYLKCSEPLASGRVILSDFYFGWQNLHRRVLIGIPPKEKALVPLKGGHRAQKNFF